MQPRLLEQAATPALPRDDVAVDRGHVGRDRQVEDRADVGEQLVAPVGARCDDRLGLLRRERLRPRGGLVRACERDGANVPERAREPDRLRGQLVLRLDEAEDGGSSGAAR